MTTKTADDLAIEARIRAHIRQQMKERGYTTYEAVAAKVGLDPTYIGRILSTHRGIGLGAVMKIAKGLKITPTRLLEEDPPDEYRDGSGSDVTRGHKPHHG